MRVLIVRHAVAGDKDDFARSGQPDGLRPLTPDGIKKMRRNVVGLRALVPEIHVLGSSPLVRARQTAEVLQAPYGVASVALVDALVPERKPVELVRWLAGLEATADDFTVAVVGHEPHLGQLVAFLLTGRRSPFAELRKGGACMVEFTGEVSGSKARLLWLATPKMLRSVGRGL